MSLFDVTPYYLRYSGILLGLDYFEAFMTWSNTLSNEVLTPDLCWWFLVRRLTKTFFRVFIFLLKLLVSGEFRHSSLGVMVPANFFLTILLSKLPEDTLIMSISS